jgi:hypothetical protein
LHRGCIQVAAVAVHVGEDRRGAAHDGGGSRRDEGAGGGDDLVAGADAQGHQREFERLGAVVQGDRVVAAEVSGVLALELAGLLAGPVVRLAGSENAVDGVEFVLGVVGPGGDGDRGCAIGCVHHCSVPDVLCLLTGSERLRSVGVVLLRVEASKACATVGILDERGVCRAWGSGTSATDCWFNSASKTERAGWSNASQGCVPGPIRLVYARAMFVGSVDRFWWAVVGRARRVRGELAHTRRCGWDGGS